MSLFVMASYTRKRLPVAPMLVHTLPSHDRAMSSPLLGAILTKKRTQRFITAASGESEMLFCICQLSSFQILDSVVGRDSLSFETARRRRPGRSIWTAS